MLRRDQDFCMVQGTRGKAGSAVGDQRNGRAFETGLDTGKDLAAGGHAHGVGTHATQGADFCGGFVTGAGHGSVDSGGTYPGKVLSEFRNKSEQVRGVRRRLRWIAPRKGVVPLYMIAEREKRSRQQIVTDTSGGIGQYRPTNSEFRCHTERLFHDMPGVAFVVVESTFADHEGLTGPMDQGPTSPMSLNGRSG